MNSYLSRMAPNPFSLSLILLIISLFLVGVNGQGNPNGLPALSTATEGPSTSSSSSSSSETSSASSTTSGTSLPTLTSGSSTNFPTATVPPTANAPYMQESNLPEGTVFIAVGAALGFIGLSVLVWRVMVAWSINRAVRRTAYEQSKIENKALLRRTSKRKSQRRSTRSRRSRRETRGTSMTLEKLSKSDRQSHVSTKTPATQSSLFFSPTAGAGAGGAAGSHLSLNRASTYLPAGYYPGSNPALGSQSQVNLGRSPPGTPPSRSVDVPFNRSSHHLGASTSSLNLTSPPQGRVPSAYLENLFDSHPPAPPTDRDHS